MKRITTPALPLFLLCPVAASARDHAAERAAILDVIDQAFSAVASDDPDGWRFFRRLQRMERFKGDD